MMKMFIQNFSEIYKNGAKKICIAFAYSMTINHVVNLK